MAENESDELDELKRELELGNLEYKIEPPKPPEWPDLVTIKPKLEKHQEPICPYNTPNPKEFLVCDKDESLEMRNKLLCAVHKKAQKERKFAIVKGVVVLIIGAILIIAGPIVFVQPSSSVVSGWLLVGGFIPIPIFFFSSPKFWGVVVTLTGLVLTGGGIQMIKEK